MVDQPLRPALSTIVITPDEFATVRRTVAALRQQTVADQIELVIVGPLKGESWFDESDLRGFAAHKVVMTDDVSSTARMRAKGVAAATAPIVALTEDHCYPAPGWAEALLSRHRDKWTGVGAVVQNGNPKTTISWANLIIEYGEWINPNEAGPVHHIGGHNSSYKRRALAAYGERLGEMLEAESTMQWELARTGHRFYLEPGARMHHVHFALFWPSMGVRFNGGRIFAANRRRGWGAGKRLAYVLGSPLIPFVRLARCLKRVPQSETLPRKLMLFPTLATLLSADGLGEMFGYAFGSGNSVAYLSDIEFHRERFLR